MSEGVADVVEGGQDEDEGRVRGGGEGGDEESGEDSLRYLQDLQCTTHGGSLDRSSTFHPEYGSRSALFDTTSCLARRQR